MSKDFYGRLMGLVYNQQGVLTNEAQVASGLATAYKKQSGCERYSSLERDAHRAHLNIWSDTSFQRPEDYKKHHRLPSV